MSNEKYAKTPTLYIHQPTSEEIQATMQYHYRTSGKKDKQNLGIKNSAESQQHTDDKVESRGVDTEKKFRDMNVEEQLLYLTKRPVFAPQVICELKTEKRLYQGVVLDYVEGLVTIQTGERRITLEKEKINQIRILGL